MVGPEEAGLEGMSEKTPTRREDDHAFCQTNRRCLAVGIRDHLSVLLLTKPLLLTSTKTLYDGMLPGCFDEKYAAMRSGCARQTRRLWPCSDNC